jgi:hypothetical protein
MCQSCQAWEGLAKQAWDEVFRLIDIAENAIAPFLPSPARAYVQERVLPMLKADPAAVEREIYVLAAPCETILPPVEAQRLHSARVSLLQGAAQRLHHLKTNVIDLSQEYLQLTRQFQALYSYAGMLNTVTQEWSDALQHQQESWDTFWATHQERQRHIDQMKIDALTGTPFFKLYIS